MAPPSIGPGRTAPLPPNAKTETLGIAFFDLSRFAEWASSEQDAQVAGFLQEFYALAAEYLGPAGGRIVKCMGDAGLAVFPEEAGEPVIDALCSLSVEARRLAHRNGLDAYLNVNVHVGPVISGDFGPPGQERFDVIGKAVNIAARLGRRGVTLSPQAFRCLDREARGRFEKITRPVTYCLRSTDR